MRKVIQIAVREFVATVSNKAFIIGLLIGPAMIALFGLVAPRMFAGQNFKVQGEFAIVDPTGLVVPEVRAALETRKDVAQRAQEAQRPSSERRKRCASWPDVAGMPRFKLRSVRFRICT